MTTTAVPETRSLDLTRQIVVISAMVFMIIAAMVGTGLFGGTAVQDLQGGALDADSTYLAPARPAFSIWSAIYIGLVAYTIWQALPGQRARDRQRAMGWWIALTMVLNGLWLVTAQFGTLLLTVIAIVVLLVALCITFRMSVLTRTTGDGFVDSLLIDGVTGLHLGWVTLATVANITAWLTTIGSPEWASAATVWGILVLIVVLLVGLSISWRSGWRIAPALALAWGLTWLAVARLTGEPQSPAIGITALVVAAVILIVPVVVAGLRLVRPSSD
ncbi:TspO/MBR family protein [Microbacterium rhizomatis]|uniref:Tryptophan-rich sensory protein n=1 Tax=Microbacterium rhizomatis TaxID=1631477 RepID=A0A5J5J0M3_9MICO|nr:TspO/MBR family protein [Microbacterium rhizomatis]KAA9107887.1 tryptophan-rich sensory protein [Microbacterium rhizomatis]